MRISFKSELRKCLSTVEPNEPVPPVIIRVALLNADIVIPFVVHSNHPNIPADSMIEYS